MDIEIRAISGMADLERWVDIHNQIRPDDPATAGGKALMRAIQNERADLLAYIDGAPVGVAVVTGDPESLETGRAYLEVGVLPAYRELGVGSALISAASDHARRFGRTGFRCDVDTGDAESLAFLERRGFVKYRRWEKLELDLASVETVTSPESPAGVEIASMAERPSELRGMHAVAAEVYPQLGGHLAGMGESFVDWQAYTFGDTDTSLDLALMAVADGGVIGFVSVKEHDAALAELRVVAVVPQWRDRVAPALVGALVERARATRQGRLIAWVQEGRDTAQVCRAVGFARVDSSVEVSGPLLS
jgi:GNAT superfamily N-acetyltransferase